MCARCISSQKFIAIIFESSKNRVVFFFKFATHVCEGICTYLELNLRRFDSQIYLFLLYALVYLVAPAARSSIVGVESLFMLMGYYVIYRLSVEMYGRSVAMLVVILGALSINYFTVSGFAICGFGVAAWSRIEAPP